MFYLFTYVGMLCNKKQEHTRKLVRFRSITYVRKVFAQECKECYNVEDPKRLIQGCLQAKTNFIRAYVEFLYILGI